MKRMLLTLIVLSLLSAACGSASISNPEAIAAFSTAFSTAAAPGVTASLTPNVTPSMTPPTLTATPTRTLTPERTPTSSWTPTSIPTLTPTATPPGGEEDALYVCQQVNSQGEKACIPAPTIEGLTAQADAGNSGTVDYVDSKGKVILLVDAEQLKDPRDQESLREVLHSLYWADPPYYPGETYPRFRFAVAGIRAGFYGLDRTLSYLQILLVKETLDLFTDPKFTAIRENFLDAGSSYVILPNLGSGIDGISIAGTKTVMLDRQSLFSNKFYLAATIAHEGAHILQGKLPSEGTCQEQLHREVGNQVIPEGFVNWPGVQVIAGVKSGQLGAYHVTYWMLANLGIPNLDNLKQVILTGKALGQPLVLCDAGK